MDGEKINQFEEEPIVREEISMRLLVLPWILSLFFGSVIAGIFTLGWEFAPLSAILFAVSFIGSIPYLVVLISMIDRHKIKTYFHFVWLQFALILLTIAVLYFIFESHEISGVILFYFLFGLILQYLMWSKKKKSNVETSEKS